MRFGLVVLTLAAIASASDVAKLRRMMVDSRFVGIVSPCKTGGTNRNNAAEWLRTAFHDAVSHDAAAGTGGIDASIQYEIDYEENGGVAFSSVITQYKFYRQEGVSLADIVALGAIVAVGSCGGPMIPFHIGRTDAERAVGEGFVPKPEQSTESHIETFRRMGFSQQEMISLIACGHTLGGVHASVNPRVTSDAYHAFDETVAAFDNRIAIGHVNDTRQNPLGQAYDAAYPERSSDSRIFSSDGNKTIGRYAESSEVFMNDCSAVFSKMFNNAVPSSVTLSGPIEPFPVSATFRLVLRNGAMTISIGSARLYDMKGKWKSFEVGYTNRDGSPGTATDFLIVKAVREISIGKPIEVRDFNAFNGLNPATGIGSIVITVTMNDGSVYSSPEGEEVVKVDDSILIDTGNAYSCSYSGEANNNANGLNITMAVLGPLSSSDRVDVILRNAAGEKKYIRASFRRARDDYYNFYGAFIPDIAIWGTTSVGARLTRADGSVSVDTRDDIYYTLSSFSKCVAGAEVPTPAPVPSAGLSRRTSRHAPAPACASGYTLCSDRCVNPATDLEHCGGCSGAGGVDCTTVSDAAVACIAGKCVLLETEY